MTLIGVLRGVGVVLLAFSLIWYWSFVQALQSVDGPFGELSVGVAMLSFGVALFLSATGLWLLLRKPTPADEMVK